MTKEESHQEYLRLAHAIQTGVEYMKQYKPDMVDPKHMRTGLNLSKVEHGALIELLIEKGLFTEEEYTGKILAKMRDEIAWCEAELTEHFGGVKIALA